MKDRETQPDYRFAHLMREIYWSMRATIDARLEPMGLSHALWRPLLVLHAADGPMTQTQLARALGVEAPTVVRQLDRLAALGWVARRNCPGDRRAYHVELTDQADALCADIETVVAGIRRQGLAGVKSADLAIAIKVMDQVRDRFAEMEAEAPKAQPAKTPTPGRGKRRAAS